MTAKTAREIIKQEYGDSRNCITPNLIRRGKMCRNIAYELSSGRGITTPTLYGVTLAMLDESTDKTERLYDDSHCFDTREDAENYIADYKQRC